MSSPINKAELIKSMKQSQNMETISESSQSTSKSCRSTRCKVDSIETIHREDESIDGRVPETEVLNKSDSILQSDLLTHMLACMIRFAAEELKLIATNYTRETSDSVCDLTNLTLEEKCRRSSFELHEYPTYLLGKDEAAYSLYKFHMDRCFIEKMFMNLVKEIKRKKSYEKFLQTLNNLLSSTEEENNYLRDTYTVNVETVNIRQKICEETQIHTDVMNGLNTELTLYKNQLQDLNKENYVKEQYIDKWEKSRNRQNHVMYKRKIAKLEWEIKDYQSNIAQEYRVNVEVEKYTHMVHVDIEKELVIWSKRYETELEEKELEIQSFKKMAQDMCDKLTRFKIQFDKQVMLIEEGRKFRAEQVDRKKILAIQEVAAVKIQAWWRGVRIRRGIGHMKKRSKRGRKKNQAKTGAVEKKRSVNVKGKK